ncbi:hydrogenase maturation protease [Legionella worsleiensis]|uniref:Hydrogenase expression/formation protein n=1 Tax=Legionella worsleiensis TaxID=45076 RepID=A0A0W1AA96_9GAMM|nr:hydrogenase maturation protease [Legionella worsleiensis]KTD78284.1 hydrogenase expression/formation protein [Legionella worsleiensis]STY32621.1 hydrogenase expression/formation protein [Legionella worsleiensis]
MNTIKVLGIGSPFGDDQAGCLVAKRLMDSDLLKLNCPFVVIEAHDRPGIRLLELMEQANKIYLVDAIQTGSPPGTIHRLINEAIFELKPMLSTHDVGIAQALELGRSLNQLPEHVILYGIEIGSFAHHSELSLPVAHAITKTAALLVKELYAESMGCIDLL